MYIHHSLVKDPVYQEHLAVVRKVATQYWNDNSTNILEALDAIEVIKVRGGKMSGFLPQYGNYPPVFFKVYFRERSYEFELEGITAANNMPQVDGMRAPKIKKLLPEYRAFILVKRIWQDSDSELKRFFIHTLNFDWVRIGKWLRNFHDFKTTTIPNDYFLQHKFRKILTLMDQLKLLFSPDELRKIQAIIKNSREHWNTQPCEWVISHGDFLLGNIKKVNNVMEVIDFEDCQMAPREFDVMNFLTRLEYTGYFPHKPSTYERIRQKFLEGYGMPINTESPIHDFFYLYIKLDAIESYNRRKQDRTNNLIKRSIYNHFETQGMLTLKDFLQKRSN